MSLDGLRDKVVADLKVAFPPIRSIEPYGGRFDLDELKRMGAQTPALRVVVLDVPTAMDNNVGQFDLVAVVAVFVLTRDAPQIPRDKAALATVTALLKVIPGNRWGLDYANRAEDVRADSLFSGTLDRTGVALWVVSWKQGVRVEPTSASGPFDDLETFVTDYFLPPVGDPPGTPAAEDKTEHLET